jgi:hypothetical protein
MTKQYPYKWLCFLKACLLAQQDNNSDDSAKKVGGTLAEISEKFIFAIQNLRNNEE